MTPTDFEQPPSYLVLGATGDIGSALCRGLVLFAAATYASRGIRVNGVAPGLVCTALTAALTSNEATLRASAVMHALGRIGEPADVASAITWLLEPRQGWITAQILGVDGGLANLRSKATA